MAQVINVTVLQKNQYALAEGEIWAISAAGFVVAPYSGTVNGVTANASITLAPTGLNQRSTTLLVTSTVAQITNQANA